MVSSPPSSDMIPGPPPSMNGKNQPAEKFVVSGSLKNLSERRETHLAPPDKANGTATSKVPLNRRKVMLCQWKLMPLPQENETHGPLKMTHSKGKDDASSARR